MEDQEWYELYRVEGKGFFFDRCAFIVKTLTFKEIRKRYNMLKESAPGIEFRAYQCKRHRVYPNGDAPQEK